MLHIPRYHPVNRRNVGNFSFIETLCASDPDWTNLWGFGLHMLPVDEPQGASITQDMMVLHLDGKIRLERQFEGRRANGTSWRGGLCLLPGNSEQTYYWSGHATVLHIGLNADLMAEVAGEMGAGDPTRVRLRERFNFRDPLVENIGYVLLNEIRAGTGGSFYADSLATSLTSHLVKNYSSLAQPRDIHIGRGLSTRQLQQVRDYIHDHLSGRLTLGELAACAGLSQTYFIRAFKQSTGLTPGQYIIQQRVEWARQLLIDSEMSIAEVAQVVGFADQSHLARCFRRLLGISPRQIRAKSYLK